MKLYTSWFKRMDSVYRVQRSNHHSFLSPKAENIPKMAIDQNNFHFRIHRHHHIRYCNLPVMHGNFQFPPSLTPLPPKKNYFYRNNVSLKSLSQTMVYFHAIIRLCVLVVEMCVRAIFCLQQMIRYYYSDDDSGKKTRNRYSFSYK